MNKANAQTIVPAYAVEGVLKYTSIRDGRGAAVDFRQQWEFKLLADNEGRWKIELHTKTSDPRLPIESTQHLAYDGTNIYDVVYSPQVIETRLGARPKVMPVTEDKGAGRISRGPCPIDYGGAVGMLWFAFFGGNHLDGSTNRARFPNLLVGDPRGNPIAWTCQLAYKLVPNSRPGIIQEGSFFFAPELLENSSTKYPEINEPTHQRSFDDLKNVFTRCKALKGDGLLRSRYVLEETRTFRGQLLPAKFHADLIAVDSSDISLRAECEITNVVQNTPAVEIKPSLQGPITILDTRFRWKGATTWRGDIHYTLDSDEWIVDTKDARIQNVVEKTPMRPILTSANLLDYGKNRRTTYLRLMLGFIVVFPLLVFATRRVLSVKKLP